MKSDLEFIVDVVSASMTEADDMFRKLAETPEYRNLPYPLRTQITEIIATQSGNLLFARNQMRDEIAKLEQKKFWQFWK
jgi:hypothetical protein